MASDARDAAGFYATALGRYAAGTLRRKLSRLWPRMAGLSVLGIGHAGPCLHLWREEAHCAAVSPVYMGVAPWPAGRPGLSCLVEEEALPFPDLSFDRILLVHGLEQAENARRTLREAWRVLKDDGRLIVVAPNRRGLWAYAEST
ncbi:MAG: class I SAM-dependent methyltransferase, partial [Acidobacteriota bacterium]|nr:class I SAM-dependent methyltransferase [Acidobacteriota bacterium]